MQIIILLLCYLIYTSSKIRRRQIQHGFAAKRRASGNVLNTIIFVQLQFHCDSWRTLKKYISMWILNNTYVTLAWAYACWIFWRNCFSYFVRRLWQQWPLVTVIQYIYTIFLQWIQVNCVSKYLILNIRVHIMYKTNISTDSLNIILEFVKFNCNVFFKFNSKFYIVYNWILFLSVVWINIVCILIIKQ